MSTIVLISGQLRTFDACIRNQVWNVYRKLPDPWFFVSCDADEDEGKSELLYRFFPRNKVFIEVVKQPTIPEPANVGELTAMSPYGPSAPPQSILRQLWHLNRVWEFYNESRLSNINIPVGKIFLRIRPDLWFHYFLLPHDELRFDSLTTEFENNVCYSPWWSRWGGINDRVGLMGGRAAAAHFTTFKRLDEMLADGAPLHPESLMAYSLEVEEVKSIAKLPAWFMTVRKPEKPGEPCKTVQPDAMINDLADYFKIL